MKFFLTAALLLLTTTLFAAGSGHEAARWWADVRYLADDKLKGRDTGSEGYLTAVRYVTKQLRASGLKPAGVNGFLQPVPFETRTLDRAKTTLTLTRAGLRETLQPGLDASVSAAADMPASVSAPMVFAGYGLSIPGVTARNVDVRGKIVVYINANGPSVAPQNVQSFYASAGERWSALRKAGAIGVATLANPRLEAPAAAPVTAPPPAPPSVLLAEEALQDSAGEKIALSITRAGAAKFFAGSAHPWEEISRLAAANQPLPEFPLAGTLEATASMTRKPMESPNVVALLPGSDPVLAKEYVVVSAHLDHLGMRTGTGDTIFNGAMDNATGVASVLAVARLFHESGMKPKRSVLFLIVTGEEKGLLGSKYFAAHPTVPAAQIVADINMDALLPLYDLKTLEVQGVSESTLGDQIRSAAKQFGVEVQTDREPEQNRFIRSDHFSFVRRGIPALAFKFGYEYGSADETTRLQWWAKHYHQVSDDTSRPMNSEGAAKFNQVIFTLLQLVANDPARPQWRSDSFFRQFAN